MLCTLHINPASWAKCMQRCVQHNPPCCRHSTTDCSLLLRRACTCRQLTHPNIVATYGCGWIDTSADNSLADRRSDKHAAFAIMMEFAELRSLRSNIQNSNRFGHQMVCVLAICHAFHGKMMLQRAPHIDVSSSSAHETLDASRNMHDTAADVFWIRNAAVAKRFKRSAGRTQVGGRCASADRCSTWREAPPLPGHGTR